MKRSSLALLVSVFLSFSFLLAGCKKTFQIDGQALAKERERLAVEKAAAREALIRELLARNLHASTPANNLWDGFRKSYPYHSQVLALSEPATADQSRTLIISEPPPSLQLGELLVPVADVLLNHTVLQHQVGHDGWTRDVVLALKGPEDKIASAISGLNQLLFATSYKSFVLPLPVPAQRTSISGLDLSVTAAEIKNWTIDQGETFLPLEGGPPLSLPDVFSKSESSVYFTNTPGLVTWWIPKAKEIQTCRVEIREFALETDLIVGAVSNDSGTLIFGRERLIPVELLPPLRAETISLLAAVQKGQEGQLEQSYERNHLFAGRLEGTKDWAPILLSPELVDTEYGSLLNITDQILKGWSNGGDTQYDNFHYPKPPRWPFQNEPVMKRLDTDELTYNWNTKGVGYTVRMGDYKMFALHRSGALPVSYIPEGAGSNRSDAVKSAEEEAYNYFATLGDANLVRVVQYDALYHIFSTFNITSSSGAVTRNTEPATVLERITDETVNEIKDASPEEKEALTVKLIPLVHGQFADFSRDELRRGIKAALDHPEPEERSAFPIVDLSDLGIPDDRVNQRWIKRIALSQLALIKHLPTSYAEEIASKANGWIHTPVVVVSSNTTGNTLGIEIGGHNLYAKTTNFVVSDEVAVGRPLVEADGTIRVNPRDAGRVSELVRTAGLDEGLETDTMATELRNVLQSVSEVPPRARGLALNLPVQERVGQGFDLPNAITLNRPAQSSGWGRFRAQSTLTDTQIAMIRQSREATPGGIIVSRDSDGAIRLFVDESNGMIQAYTTEDATDVVLQLMRKSQSKDALKVDLKGFSPEEATAFSKTIEIRAGDQNIPKEISALVTDGPLEQVRLKQFDFAKTVVRDVGIETLPTGETRSTISVEVPAKGTSEVGKTKIEMLFDKNTPREIVSGITRMVKDAIARVITKLGDTIDMITFNREINLEIKRISRETGVELKVLRQQFNSERHDLHFVRKDPLIEQPGSESAGG
jgi:hypothetical protein